MTGMPSSSPHSPHSQPQASTLTNTATGLMLLVRLVSQGVSRLPTRVWMISDTFIIADVYRYISHIRALGAQGIAFRFLLVTPWGWTEIPLAADGTPGNRMIWNNRKGGAAPGEDERKRDDRLTR